MNIEEFKRMNMEDRLSATVCSVEATSFESLCLWEKYNDSREGRGLGQHVKWEEILDGWLPTVGYLNKRPVAISVNWAFINGQPVLFWHATSKVVNYDMIEEWLKKMMPQVYSNQPRRSTDAQNFYNIVHTINEISKESAKA